MTVILCAQRPDSDVLPGQIKSNMTVRICGRSNATLSTIIIGDGRASEQIPHNARGRFLMEDGTLLISFSDAVALISATAFFFSFYC